jgi:hypothetical protein
MPAYLYRLKRSDPILFSMAQLPLVGRGFLVIQASRSHSDTLCRTPLDEWSDRRRYTYLITQHSQETDIHAPGGIRTRNTSKRAATESRLRPRGHWDRHRTKLQNLITFSLPSSRVSSQSHHIILFTNNAHVSYFPPIRINRLAVSLV